MADSIEELADAILAKNGKAIRQAFTRMLAEDGFAIVPREPTREMWAAGGDAAVTHGNVHHDRLTGDIWSAMVAAGALKP